MTHRTTDFLLLFFILKEQLIACLLALLLLFFLILDCFVSLGLFFQPVRREQVKPGLGFAVGAVPTALPGLESKQSERCPYFSRELCSMGVKLCPEQT